VEKGEIRGEKKNVFITGRAPEKEKRGIPPFESCGTKNNQRESHKASTRKERSTKVLTRRV